MDYEFAIARRYRLFWSNTCIESSRGEILADGRYIYEPDRFSTLFFAIFNKLQQLNDHCFYQLLSFHTRQDDLATLRDAAINDFTMGAEELIYIDEKVDALENTTQVAIVATSTVLLCSFIEWGLKLVANEMCGPKPQRRDRSLNQIASMLHHIEQHGRLELHIDPDQLLFIGTFRKIRNAFAHGDWERLGGQLSSTFLRTGFEAVSGIFQAIEFAAWQSPWGEARPSGGH